MGFLDKAKEAAEKAKVATQQAAHQGQAKIDTMQQSKSEGELFKALGQAVYSNQRQGGDHERVDAALAALDAHYAGISAAATASVQDAAPAGPAAAPAPAPAPPPAAPAGNFTLDDL